MTTADHPIPPMLDPLGAYWLQPKREEIQIDLKHALMGRSAFAKLSEYSCSQPSGVYPGKMWKKQLAQERPVNEVMTPAGSWVLCWYGPAYPEGHKWHGSVSNEYRIILVVD